MRNLCCVFIFSVLYLVYVKTLDFPIDLEVCLYKYYV
jgi:hypothetical protein